MWISHNKEQTTSHWRIQELLDEPGGGRGRGRQTYLVIFPENLSRREQISTSEMVPVVGGLGLSGSPFPGLANKSMFNLSKHHYSRCASHCKRIYYRFPSRIWVFKTFGTCLIVSDTLVVRLKMSPEDTLHWIQFTTESVIVSDSLWEIPCRYVLYISSITSMRLLGCSSTDTRYLLSYAECWNTIRKLNALRSVWNLDLFKKIERPKYN